MNTGSLSLQRIFIHFFYNKIIMSPRPKRFRTMCQPPVIRGFRPYGSSTELTGAVKLLFEEYEAIRLADYENLSHTIAAKMMNISRPTFTRIYDNARKKIAQAFMENSSIVIDGGNVRFDEEWFRCSNCNTTFKAQKKENKTMECPICHSEKIININSTIKNKTDTKNYKNMSRNRNKGFCICPKCGIKISHQAGIPCREIICNECGTNMIKDIE